MFSFCFSLRSTVTGELALCCLTLYSWYSIWTTDTQAIQEVPLKLHKTPINTVHNMETLVVKCSNFIISASWCLKCSFSEIQFWWHHTWSFIPCYILNHAVTTRSVHVSQQWACQPEHRKHISYFSLTTIKTSYKLTHNSYTKLPQYQQYKTNIFWNNLRSLIWNCRRTLLHKTLHFTNIALHSQIKQTSFAMKSNSENSSHKQYRQVVVCTTAW